MHLISQKNIFIIGGGPSVSDYDLRPLSRFGYVLGVNDSIFNTSCHGVFSMDGRWFANRWWRIKDMDIDIFARRCAFQKHVGEFDGRDRFYFYDHKVYQQGMSESKDILWGDNSGFAALNYAYLCKPKSVFLFGFDLTSIEKDGEIKEHWYPNYEWRQKVKRSVKFSGWIKDHDIAAEQFKRGGVNVYNISDITRIKAYKRIRYEEIRNYI